MEKKTVVKFWVFIKVFVERQRAPQFELSWVILENGAAAQGCRYVLSLLTGSCVGFAVLPCFMWWWCGPLSLQHWLLFREQVLDSLQSCGIYFGPVMSYLNSKICLSVKGSVYLSLLKLTQKMEFSSHTSRLLFHAEAPRIHCSSNGNSTRLILSWRLGFPRCTQQVPSSSVLPPCKHPTRAMAAAVYTGLPLSHR